MQAIIISNADAANLLDLLKLEHFESLAHRQFSTTFWNEHKPACEELLSDMHRKFHYIVTRWLQEQGATTIR